MSQTGAHIEGLDVVMSLLGGMAKRAQNWTDTSGRLHDWLLRRERERFESEGASEGSKWAGYGGEPKYASFKKAALGDMTLMRWKGGPERLYPSLTRPGHPEHVFTVGHGGITFGTSVPWADRLHRGGTNQFGEAAPARELAVLGPKSRKKLAQLLAIYVARGDSRGNQWER